MCSFPMLIGALLSLPLPRAVTFVQNARSSCDGARHHQLHVRDDIIQERASFLCALPSLMACMPALSCIGSWCMCTCQTL